MAMFESLSNRLSGVFDKLRKKGLLTEEDINLAAREVRIALLEADVALPVVKDFIANFREKAVGAEIVRSVSPTQMVVKLVHDHLIELLEDENQELKLSTNPPTVLLMAGLQGSGKTTSSGKLAHHLKNKRNKKVLLASLDVYRPAAQTQLEVLSKQVGVSGLPIIAGQQPLDIARRALQEATRGGYDVLILDTAGRLHVDDALMEELKAVKEIVKPHETLLVADSLTGQDAVNIAKTFHEKIGVTGIILTRVDGDGRGGAALSMRHITQCPIKFVGMGEKITDLEPFFPRRVASRILDMGDVVSLVERAAEAVDKEEAEKMAAKFQKGQFDLDDLAAQLKNMRKMGGIASMMNMLPGIGKLKEQVDMSKVDERILLRQEAILSSMTAHERKNPKVLNASRKRRIAIGSGTTVQDINKLLKQHQQMETVMKQFKKGGLKSLMKGNMKDLLGMKM
jgi:signal recognition particle subunit SRP54